MNENCETGPPGPGEMDAILKFLPAFEREGYVAGEWHFAEGHAPVFAMTGEVLNFISALYDDGWVVTFDWPEWQEAAAEYFRSADAIATADMQTIRKLLTTHVRKNRFCDGHLAAMIESGHIPALLRRIRDIRKGKE